MDAFDLLVSLADDVSWLLGLTCVVEGLDGQERTGLRVPSLGVRVVVPSGVAESDLETNSYHKRGYVQIEDADTGALLFKHPFSDDWRDWTVEQMVRLLYEQTTEMPLDSDEDFSYYSGA